MIMVRELTDKEISQIALKYQTGDSQWDGMNEIWFDSFDHLGFAKALFEAARVQQTTERTNGQG